VLCWWFKHNVSEYPEIINAIPLACRHALNPQTTLLSCILPAAVNTNTVRPVAEAAGSAATAGLDTTIFAEAVAAAYFTGGVPNEAMTEAFRKAAQTGGCKGVIQVLERELAGDWPASHAVDPWFIRHSLTAVCDLYCASCRHAVMTAIQQKSAVLKHKQPDVWVCPFLPAPTLPNTHTTCTEARAVAIAKGLNSESGVAHSVIDDIQANHCSPPAPPPVTAAAAAPANNLPQCIGFWR
jgi:hypothetical protein